MACINSVVRITFFPVIQSASLVCGFITFVASWHQLNKVLSKLDCCSSAMLPFKTSCTWFTSRLLRFKKNKERTRASHIFFGLFCLYLVVKNDAPNQSQSKFGIPVDNVVGAYIHQLNLVENEPVIFCSTIFQHAFKNWRHFDCSLYKYSRCVCLIIEKRSWHCSGGGLSYAPFPVSVIKINRS